MSITALSTGYHRHREHATKTDPQTRHARYVQELAHKLADAKAELATVRSRMWQHSSDFAIMSRLKDQADAATAAKDHRRLLPEYRAALGKVDLAAAQLTAECIDYSERWGATHEAWLVPECTHHDRHAGHTWRIPRCVLCVS